jgi:hypothetical protein
MAINVIKSVSIPEELAQFLDKNPELSLSKIVQARLIEMKEQKTIYENRLKVYENKLGVVTRELFAANEEIERLKGGKNGNKL